MSLESACTAARRSPRVRQFGGKRRPARPLHNAARPSANQRFQVMGTELLIIVVTVSFYALCALFVRVCDRI
jgi:hypothetical protein